MNELRYCWLRLMVWYHTNFCFSENEVQLLSVRFIRKGSPVKVSTVDVVAVTKNWIIVVE